MPTVSQQRNKISSRKSVKRLSIYRRILLRMINRGENVIRSQELAAKAGVSAAQVRRDIMAIGYSGSPNRGYDCPMLYESIGEFLGANKTLRAVLFGVGNIGRAVLGYFDTRKLNIQISACFDIDTRIIGTVIHNCPCYSVDELEHVVRHLDANLGIVAVPFKEAQNAASALVKSGVKGLLNFAPANLVVPDGVYVEDIDITAALETISFFVENKTT